MEKVFNIRRKCLVCRHSGSISEFGDHEQVAVCPKCNGAFVDLFYLDKYRSGSNYAQEKDRTSLLVIELQDENSIPKVFYKGEEITNRIQISFDWVTAGQRDFGGMEFLIKHGDEKGIAHTVGKSRGEFI